MLEDALQTDVDRPARWYTRLDETGHGYPRPLLAREQWTSLNGSWEFAIDPDARWTRPSDVAWTGRIQVPYAPESAASGIGDTGFYIACWYRRALPVPPLEPDERLVLHFGAVDYRASVWVNGRLATTHEGGYTPFSVDITRHLISDEPPVVVVRAEDDPQDLTKPRGKQDWQLNPHGIWYPRTTGIWQTVWMERVPAVHMGTLQWTAALDRWEIGVKMRLRGPTARGYSLRVMLRAGAAALAEDTYSVDAGEVHRFVALSDPGIDDFRNELLWSPARPTLIEADLTLLDQRGAVVDTVQSYTALRAMGTEGDRFVLNGRPFPLRLVLDQGYWVETGLTPPGEAAIRRDIQLTRAMGFNGARKHQKIEDPRYLHWADRLGLLIWEEMPSAYRYTTESIARVAQQWTAALVRDMSHPCISAWVPFNESWGVPNLPNNAAERHFVLALYHLTKALDPSRPVIGNDGWESVATDIIGIHDYDQDPARIESRYKAGDPRPRLFRHERPGGRRLVLDGDPQLAQPIVLSEFGGIALSDDAVSWGYGRSATAEALAARFTALLETVRSLELLCGFCYTQFCDTYQEANGLLYADRRPKFPIEQIARAIAGREFVSPVEAAEPPAALPETR